MTQPTIVSTPSTLSEAPPEVRSAPSATPTVLDAARSLVPLGPWLDRCTTAGVPFIPADFSQPFPVDQMYNVLDRSGETTEILAALSWARERIREETEAGRQVMFRYECGCTTDVKHHLASGRNYKDPDNLYSKPHAPVNPFHSITVDDPRLFDIIVGATERVGIRPFITPLILRRYPLEFRVFYGPEGYQGISNYYPQRPLSPIFEHSNFVRDCRLGAAALYEITGGYEAFPLGFTADFLVPKTGPLGDYGGVLFLEGGPPHHLGPISAHPCCMAPGQIHGIALSRRPGALEF